MKLRLLLFVSFVSFVVNLRAGTFDLQINYNDFIAGNLGSPGMGVGTNRVHLEPISAFGTSGSTIVLGDRRTFTNTSPSVLYVSNLFNGRSYRVEIVGRYTTTTYTNSFDTNVTGLVNSSDYIASVINDGATLAYSQTAADARFLRRTNDSGTNLTFRGTITFPATAVSNHVWTATNASGAGFWSPAAGGPANALTNNDTRLVTLANATFQVGDGDPDGAHARLGLWSPQDGWKYISSTEGLWTFDYPLLADASLLTNASASLLFGSGTVPAARLPATVTTNNGLLTSGALLGGDGGRGAANVVVGAGLSLAAGTLTATGGASDTNNLIRVWNVRDYGATGGNIAADSVAVLNAASNLFRYGGVLYFPRGTYWLTNQLAAPNLSTNTVSVYANDLSIMGDGMGATTIRLYVTNGVFYKGPMLPNVRDATFISYNSEPTATNGAFHSTGIGVGTVFKRVGFWNFTNSTAVLASASDAMVLESLQGQFNAIMVRLLKYSDNTRIQGWGSYHTIAPIVIGGYAIEGGAEVETVRVDFLGHHNPYNVIVAGDSRGAVISGYYENSTPTSRGHVAFGYPLDLMPAETNNPTIQFATLRDNYAGGPSGYIPLAHLIVPVTRLKIENCYGWLGVSNLTAATQLILDNNNFTGHAATDNGTAWLPANSAQDILLNRGVEMWHYGSSTNKVLDFDPANQTFEQVGTTTLYGSVGRSNSLTVSAAGISSTNTAAASRGFEATDTKFAAHYGGPNTLVVTNGRVGIGDSTPGYALEIVGSTYASGSVYSGDNMALGNQSLGLSGAWNLSGRNGNRGWIGLSDGQYYTNIQGVVFGAFFSSAASFDVPTKPTIGMEQAAVPPALRIFAGTNQAAGASLIVNSNLLIGGYTISTNGYSSRSNVFLLLPTNTISGPGVIEATGLQTSTVHTRWKASGNRAVQLTEEFLGGDVEDGEIGELGWRIISGTVTALIPVASETNRAGLYRISNASSNEPSGIVLAQGVGTAAGVVPASGLEVRYEFRPQATNLADILVGMSSGGRQSPVKVPSPGGFQMNHSGVWLVSTNGSNFYLHARTSSAGTESWADTGVAPVVGNWYSLVLTFNGATWSASVNGGSAVTATGASLPSFATVLGPVFQVVSATATAKELDVEFFDLYQPVTR